MSRAVALLFVLIAPGCGKTNAEPRKAPLLPEAPLAAGPGRARGAIASEEDAIRTFRAAWTEEVVPPLPGFRRRGDDETRIALTDAGGRHQRAARHPCDEVAKYTMRSLAMSDASGMEELNVFGSHATVERDGDCWSVDSSGPPGTEVSGILSASTGALLWVYVSPEG